MGGGGGDQKSKKSETRRVTVKVNHGERAVIRNRKVNGDGKYVVDVSPQDSIRALKERIAAVMSKDSPIDADLLELTFGPNDRPLGKRFQGDPLIDEESILVDQCGFLKWLDMFDWHLTLRMLKDTPPPPGVAIKKAAASAEGEDPEKAVEEAYRTGELLRSEELPAPWGPKGTDIYQKDPLVKAIGDNLDPPVYPTAT
jgi:hypothetical protein